MRTGIVALLVFLSNAINAQDFPRKFIGHWEGELEWYQAGRTSPKKIKMQLLVQPLDSANQYTWQIIYGEKTEDNRPYVLKAVDTAKGHWQIDERNGIILDQYWIGNRFASAFTVQTSTILDSYWLEGENLIVEFYSISSKPVNTTGQGTEDSPKVDSYSAKAFQRAVLRKVGS